MPNLKRKFSGMCSGYNSNSRSRGSAGLNRCRRWLAALARFTGFGKLGHGSSVRASISTSLTIADAGLNKFVTASFSSLQLSGLLSLRPLALGDCAGPKTLIKEKNVKLWVPLV